MKPSKGFNQGDNMLRILFCKIAPTEVSTDQRGFRWIVVICHPVTDDGSSAQRGQWSQSAMDELGRDFRMNRPPWCLGYGVRERGVSRVCVR